MGESKPHVPSRRILKLFSIPANLDGDSGVNKIFPSSFLLVFPRSLSSGTNECDQVMDDPQE